MMQYGCDMPILISVVNLCTDQRFLPLIRVLLIRVRELSTGAQIGSWGI